MNVIPDGIHLRLPETDYFAVDALGSSDLIKLYQQGEGWWWSSRLNPARFEKENDAKNFGHALHKIVLEGVPAYEAAFAVAPDKRQYEGLCVTIADMRDVLADGGWRLKASASKLEATEAMREFLPEIPVWDTILDEFEAALNGKETVSVDEDQQLRIMADAVHSHPEIGKLFAFNAANLPIAEASIFWTEPDGLRRRARLDELLPTVTCDLKSLGNWSGRPLPFEVGKIVCDRGYDIQLADYHKARKIAYRCIAEGKVFGATPEELAWLARFPAEAPHWGWAWLFYQKPDAAAGRAPVLFPWWEDYGSEIHLWGHRKAFKALATYRRCMAAYGPTRPWTRVEPLHVTSEGFDHRVYLPHYIADNDPVPDEMEAIA